MESALRAGGRDPALRLIETFAGDAPEGRIARHLARMAQGAAALGWDFDGDAARAAFSAHRALPVRLRLTLDRAGRFAVEAGPLPPPATAWRVTLAENRLSSADPWLSLKTTRRAAYDAARAALSPGMDEAVFRNERDEICDCTITTLFFDRGEGLRTPPLACGLLPGILRAEMLDRGAREEVLQARDLPRVRLWVGNALRGLIPAELRPGPYSAAWASDRAAPSR